jgi:multidrug efflux pump subunit AcrA (membrane-fusion protein)
MADEVKPQAGEPETDPTTPEGQDPEAQQALPEGADARLKKANREAASYRVKLRETEAELARLKKAEADAKAKDMTETERAKAEAASARADAERAKAEAAAARAEKSIARSGVLEKYENVMSSELLRAQADNPELDVNDWIQTYKDGHAELFGAAKPAEPTGGGGPPPGKTGSRKEEIDKLEKELEHRRSPMMRNRRGADLQRIGITRRLATLRGQ